MLQKGGKIHNDEELEKFVKWIEEFKFVIMKIPKLIKFFFLSAPPEISMKLISEKNEKRIKNMTEKDVQESDINYLKNAFKKELKLVKCFDGK
jgi:thymidylate kinase